MVYYMSWTLTHALDVVEKDGTLRQLSSKGSRTVRGVEHAVWCIKDNGGRNKRGSAIASTVLGERQYRGKLSARFAHQNSQRLLDRTIGVLRKQPSTPTVDLSAPAAENLTLNSCPSTTSTAVAQNTVNLYEEVTVIAAAAVCGCTYGSKETTTLPDFAFSVGTAIVPTGSMATALTSVSV